MSQLNVNTIGARTGTEISIASGHSLKDASGNAFVTNGGITEIDRWALTSNISSNGDITSNLSRVSHTLSGYKGTGMSQSSGIFTFPSTGFWQVSMKVMIEASNDPTAELSLHATDDNSSYSSIMFVTAGTRAAAGATYFNIDTSVILDIEDVSTDKIKFATDSMASNSTIYGNSDGSRTAFTFIRLADT
jgi:hypothetical protein